MIHFVGDMCEPNAMAMYPVVIDIDILLKTTTVNLIVVLEEKSEDHESQ